MKKLILILLSFIIIAALLTGCAGKPAVEQNSSKASAAESTELDDKTAEDLNKAMEALATKGWPKDKLPPDLPEFTEGEIINSGGEADEFYIKIDKTTKEALTGYLRKLKEQGWSVEDGRQAEAEKGIHSISFSWQGEDHLQIVLYTAETAAWPKDKLPPDVIPPADCTFIGDMDLLETVEDQVWYMNYQCDGINEEEANAYMNMLIENGWQGDTYMVTKAIEWNGKKFDASIEVYETDDNSSTFTLNMSVSQ